MNINDIAKAGRIEKKSAKKTKKSVAPGFFELLEGQLAPAGETGEAAAAAATGQTAPAKEASSIPARLRIEGLSLSENTINMLESFARALENLDLDEDDLRPLVEALETDTTTLIDIREQLPEDDPLARLIDRVAAVSYIEAEKFRRGDYS